MLLSRVCAEFSEAETLPFFPLGQLANGEGKRGWVEIKPVCPTGKVRHRSHSYIP